MADVQKGALQLTSHKFLEHVFVDMYRIQLEK